MTKRIGVVLLLLLIPAATAFAKANIIIVNTDAAGVGLNDPTPVQPIGGNTGTTVGAQRLIAFQTVAGIWGNLLNSDVDIRVSASFASLQCDASSAILGQARAATLVSNFPNAPLANTWYPIALGNMFAKKDLAAGGPHIIAQFNSALNGSMSCLSGVGWYYGLDAQHGNNEDFITVLLHEFGHGLGFIGNVDTTTGKFRLTGGLPSVFDLHVFDESVGLHLDQMSDAQRLNSITDTGKLVWDGPSVKTAGLDDANTDGPTTTDGCTALTNASAVTGRIALIDRGTCTFVTKVKNAQNAGAIGVIIADNRVESPPPGMGGTDSTITIPALSVSQADGVTLRAGLTGTVGTRLFADATKLAGASSTGDDAVLLYTPGTVESGSTLYHWDTSAFPNLLMEPNISPDLTHGVDLTLNVFIDIGWSTTLNTVVPGRRILKRGH